MFRTRPDLTRAKDAAKEAGDLEIQGPPQRFKHALFELVVQLAESNEVEIRIRGVLVRGIVVMIEGTVSVYRGRVRNLGTKDAAIAVDFHIIHRGIDNRIGPSVARHLHRAAGRRRTGRRLRKIEYQGFRYSADVAPRSAF